MSDDTAAIERLRTLMMSLGLEHPATVYAPEGYEIWLNHVVHEILRSATQDSDSDAVADILRQLVDANACGILHHGSGIWNDAEVVLAAPTKDELGHDSP